MNNLLPPQVVRLTGLTAAIAGLYILAHHFLVPSSFGQYGWFRGDALKEIASRPLQYAGRQACLECHAEVGTMQSDSKHGALSCEACHGPSQAHALNSDTKPDRSPDSAICLRCHEANPSRPANFQQVVVATHAGNQTCTECHQPHSPMEDPS